ncbi:MAG TPA: hypothetical protein VHH34_24145 [Pseudonocardiaceae bacterium]|nr:hypothetical protein [Pseudonocardiaceae bacterium]
MTRVDAAKWWDRPFIYWGRCRSGCRWFWAAYDLDHIDAPRHGWCDTEPEAVAAVQAAVTDLAGSRLVNVRVRHGSAARVLREINAERRKARPSSGSTEAGAVEYLYRIFTPEDNLLDDVVMSMRITKKTPKRIYYLRDELHGTVGYVDRQELETTGQAFYHNGTGSFIIYAQPPDISGWKPPTPAEQQAELSRLRAEMAAAHPDHGGTDQEFIAAHQRYKQAQRRRTT